ncbi:MULTISPECIES: DUF2637 domain-containing protein [unclassified Streptomyces]|uniref:DUF2637 domain-containing protein n=1 Tax=unclassified Streptomyces TaxID=2593676 RepID=UPI000374CD8C|nr:MULTISPECIES: DUF2637 domain-containing protein [unclassified Streptomyces]MYX32260.1 DUF2637 domain-containing protein [Streptomyces sp. SID8377]
MRSKLRPDAVLVQAVIAGALSFAHLHDIAEAAGQHGWKAWAYPVSVDLLLVAAWRRLRLLRATDSPVRAAWFWFAVALAASLGANIATAGLLDLADVPAWLRILVAGWPALAFLGGTLLVHAPAPADAAEPVEPDPEPIAAVESQREAVGGSEPAPPALPAPPAPPVPAALLAYAHKVADAHRAASGTEIDTDTLRARLGVPAPLAAAIAAQLT